LGSPPARQRIAVKFTLVFVAVKLMLQMASGMDKTKGRQDLEGRAHPQTAFGCLKEFSVVQTKKKEKMTDRHGTD